MSKVLNIVYLLLVPVLVMGRHNMSLVKSVLSVMFTQKQWTNTPIFVGHTTKNNDLISFIMWLQQELEITTLTVDSYNPPEEYAPLGNLNVTADNSVSVFFCHGSQDIVWFNIDKCLHRLRRSRLIVVLRSQRSGSRKAIFNIFKRLWQLQFLNVLVLHKDQIYSYSPYPTVHFFRMDIETNPLFSPPAQNFQGYVVSTPVENDIPRVFMVRDHSTGRRRIRGYAYRTFVEYLHRHNASLHVTNPDADLSPTSNVNMSRIVQLIMDDQLEISVHPYVNTPKDWGDKSYPLVVSPNCLIVPVRNEIPRHMYLLRPFDASCWYSLLGALLFITGALYCLSPSRKRHHWSLELSSSFLDAVSRLLFICSPIKTYRPSIRYFVVCLQLAVLGFVITSWYNIELDSFLTALVVGEQVNSIEQLVQQQQKVLVKEYETAIILRHVEACMVEKVALLLVGVDASEQVSALLSFNRSYAYPFTEERWTFFAMQQQYAYKPIFRFSTACLGSPLIGYPMRSNCHLEYTLNLFIMKIQDSGLLSHWLISDFNDAMRAGYVTLLDNVLGFQAIDLDTLRLAWFVLGFGWTVSSLVFSCEYYHFYPWRILTGFR
ncbi:uncharacterized protein Ir51b [Drosophila bipectinata]|uniref:uncharacterized protein Ir51b n=1 Tax=Drosophila bipectinata TaxID=42026 RepID=UPI001C8AF2C8|nr:uncharacterized protein LOC108133128 [Drosophila bipectinata]